MDHHKKVLGIIYIITASLSILIMLLVSAFMGTLFEFIIDKAKEEDAELVLQAVKSLVTGIVWVITIFVSIPSIIAGIGLLNKQRWALTLALILGCLKLLSFPIGTAIGVYSIWVYTENSRLEKEQANNVVSK
jgi:putative Mn2+ efflux pump MntP